jgi:hypothetical protein
MSIPNLGNGKMHALRADKGAIETKLKTVDIPKLSPQDVLIEVKSADLSPEPFHALEVLATPAAANHLRTRGCWCHRETQRPCPQCIDWIAGATV